VDPNNEVFLLDNSGHGTGTLGVLAGGPTGGTPEVALGGAAEAEVLPVRISDRVVLLRTSALAAGLQYAADSRCDVITLSMGGLPSRLEGSFGPALVMGQAIAAYTPNIPWPQYE
jgi:hypothetical protein